MITVEMFKLQNGVVHWVDEPELVLARAAGATRKLSIPFGRPAGGRPVSGRGFIVRVGGSYVLTSDIKAALADGGRWPWEYGGTFLPLGADFDHETVSRMWEFNAGNICWKGQPHVSLPAGSLAKGSQLACGSRRVIFTRGVGFVSTDIEGLLAQNFM